MSDRSFGVNWGLSALTEPIGASEFLSGHWPDRCFVGHGKVERFAGVFDLPQLASVEALLASVDHAVRVWPPLDAGCEEARLVSAQAALELYAAGWTVYLNQVEHSVPRLLPFIRQLESELGLGYGEIATEVFASRGTAGARAHCDFDFGFNVQLQGSKTWRLAPNLNFKNPHTSVIVSDEFDAEVAAYSQGALPREMPSEGASEHTAEPGSVVFVPRGHWHMTRALEPSLALTFARKGVMWCELAARELLLKLRQHEGWRAFPAATPSPEADAIARARTLDQLLQHLREELRSWSAPALLHRWQKSKVPLYRSQGRARLEHFADAESEGDVLCTIGTDGSTSTLSVSSEHAPLVRAAVLSNFPLAARDLAALVGSTPTLAESVLNALQRVGALEEI